MSHVIQQMFALNNPDTGVSENVGMVEGGLRPNVIAPMSTAEIDVRVPTQDTARLVEKAIIGIKPVTEDVVVTITGQVNRAPLERTPANQALWRLAQGAATEMDIQIDQGMAGGGSDGNTTSQFTATLDGLGAVGDGAHATHEFIYLDKMLERSTLLGLLLLTDQ
jgi:glutamate carboxypeptidase